MKIVIILLLVSLSLSKTKASVNAGGGSNVPIWIEVTFNGERGIYGSIEDYDFYAVLEPGEEDIMDKEWPQNRVELMANGAVLIKLNTQGFSRTHTTSDCITIYATHKCGAVAKLILDPAPVAKVTLQVGNPRGWLNFIYQP